MLLGIIGCGKMGSALLEGALAKGIMGPEKIFVGAPGRASSQAFAEKHGLESLETVALASHCDAVLLAAKPHQLPSILNELSDVDLSDTLLISVAAGVTISSIQEMVGSSAPVIRAMPNTPSLIGEGASAFASSPEVAADQIDFCQDFLSSVGICHRVEESLINAVTGVSGSGPAYIYLVIEALADGGVRQGLPRDVALSLATQTVLGSAAMVRDTGLHPAQLKDQVTSPGGTTIAALSSLEAAGTRAAFIDAVAAAKKRADELGS